MITPPNGSADASGMNPIESSEARHRKELTPIPPPPEPFCSPPFLVPPPKKMPSSPVTLPARFWRWIRSLGGGGVESSSRLQPTAAPTRTAHRSKRGARNRGDMVRFVELLGGADPSQNPGSVQGCRAPRGAWSPAFGGESGEARAKEKGCWIAPAPLKERTEWQWA